MMMLSLFEAHPLADAILFMTVSVTPCFGLVAQIKSLCCNFSFFSLKADQLTEEQIAGIYLIHSTKGEF